MKTRVFILLLAVGCLGIAGIIFLYFSLSKPINPRVRPSVVPLTAGWKGGADGGDWIDCTATAQRDVFQCSIYNDYNGSTIYEGEFILEGEPIPVEDLIEHISFFDGEYMYMLDGRRLTPRTPVDPQKQE